MGRGLLTVVVLTLAYTHSNVARQVVPMFIGPIQSDLGLSDVGISLAGGFAFALFYSVMGVPLGRLVDLADRRRLIVISVFLWTAMTAICGWGISLVLFIIGRIGLGLAEAVVVPASLSIFHDQFPRHRLTLAVNVFFTGAWFGNGIAYLLGAWVLDHGAQIGSAAAVLGSLQPWQGAFLTVAAAGVPVWLLCLLLREPVRQGVRPAAAESVVSASSAGSPAATQLLKASFSENPRLYVGIILGATIYSAAVSGAAFWAVEFFVRGFGSDRATISSIYGLQGILAGPAGLIVAGWLADRAELGGRPDAKLRVAIGSILLLAILALAFPLVRTENAAIALYVGLTALTPVAYGTCAAALQSATPTDRQGLMVGLYTFTTNSVGMGLGPTLIALAAEFAGVSGSGLAGGIALVMVVTLPIAAVLLGAAVAPYRALVVRGLSLNSNRTT